MYLARPTEDLGIDSVLVIIIEVGESVDFSVHIIIKMENTERE